jgi:phage baseplate assembly protein W
MALISKKFVDLNPTFSKNPITGDIATLKNEAAIKQSLKNIITTSTNERPFMPFFGAGTAVALFEDFNYTTDASVALSIRNAIAAYEPRIVVEDVNVISDIDTNTLNIDITFSIVGIPLDVQSLNLILERV